MNQKTRTIEDRILARSIFYALEMFGDVKYEGFLTGKTGPLERKWFTRFAGEWKIARTIQQGMLDTVCVYLDDSFRKALERGGGAKAVDDAAEQIKASGWSAQPSDKSPVLPISLVSKVGFLFQPATLVPYDSFALKGLNKKRRLKGETALYAPTYAEFLAAFDKQYAELEPEIELALDEDWVAPFAKKLNCRADLLTTPDLKRKVFDNVLMYSGNYDGAPR